MKTLTLGLLKTPADYRKALKKAEHRISNRADDILSKVSIAQAPCDISLDLRSVADLGFTSMTRYDVICARAQKLGLELCPAEVGLAMLLAYTSQSVDNYQNIAMDPLVGSNGDLGLFVIEYDSWEQRWLSVRYGAPSLLWGLGSRFVFRASPTSISP